MWRLRRRLPREVFRRSFCSRFLEKASEGDSRSRFPESVSRGKEVILPLPEFQKFPTSQKIAHLCDVVNQEPRYRPKCTWQCAVYVGRHVVRAT